MVKFFVKLSYIDNTSKHVAANSALCDVAHVCRINFMGKFQLSSHGI